MAETSNIKQIAEQFWQYSWQFYAATYQGKPVASVCLRLQDDFDANINALLLCCFMQTKSYELSQQALVQLLQVIEESDAEIRSLREKRRKAKLYIEDEASKAAYQALKKEELQKEKEQQQILVAAMLDIDSQCMKELMDQARFNNLSQYELLLSRGNNPHNQELKRHINWLYEASLSFNSL
ncbi:TIGR02444 family protein [Paraneptunicella aestuarii]|uniref:TIGR02444 family protein n=1 Tax=Paraneptunicella aestuarii TaxID=2831148 RepID=UPI001E4964AF|nr:TIGR02444 family protein [Paraneptunicella aestuarii]UAA38898.1 TIGR02444 family protein [Paraneptunicella aestuarii]